MATTREIYVRERIASAAALAELLGWFWANVLTETAAPLSVKRKINVPPTCVCIRILKFYSRESRMFPFEIRVAYPNVKNTFTCNGILT